MNLIPLGTNGYFPSFNRHSACYLITGAKKLIILDAGSGLFRFAEPKIKKILKEYQEIHLYLSHYHLDHTFGFYAAHHFFKDKKVKVFGNQTNQIFWEFVKFKHFPEEFSGRHPNFSWHKLKTGINIISDYRVLLRQQYHRGEGSLAYRFEFKNGKSLAYVTDSEPNMESVEFVRGADILLHEHDKETEKSKFKEGIILEKLFNGVHTTTAGACMIARNADAKKLILIHHNAFMNNEELQADEKQARKLFNDSYSAIDLKPIDF